MRRNKWCIMIAAALLLFNLGPGGDLFAADASDAGDGHTIKIDIPVVLEKANVVFNMDHLAFAGDLPVGIHYMHLLAKRFKEQGTKGRIIGVFHGDAAYMTLNDKAYNAFRKVETGNPYKGLIAELIKQGVEVEECAVSMKGHKWGNEDLLPDIKVNAGAVARLTELIQQGYVQMQP